MKKLFTVILISLVIGTIDAQEKVYNIDDVEINPDFPGGKVAFAKYISKTYEMPEDVRESGVIQLSFIIEPTGKLSNIKILKDLGGGSGEEAIRVLSASPAWSPGKIKGIPVRVSHIFPIQLN